MRVSCHTVDRVSIEVSIRSVTFSAGDAVAVPESGVLLVVGPNNVGKSLALREIAALFTNPESPHAPTKVISCIDVHKSGDQAAFEQWLDVHARRRELPGQPRTYSRPNVGRMEWSTLQSNWQSGPPFQQAASLFHAYLGPGERLGLLGSSNLWDIANEEPTHPLQFMYETVEREEAVRTASLEAFGQPLFVNRYAGAQIHLQLGEPPEPTPPPPPIELVRELASRPHAHEQGDGIRSFMGILLTLLTGDQKVLIIDEPEAFLHPPQAKLLGRKLALAADTGKQIIAATHSSEIVIGALEAPNTAVTIVRVVREGGVNRASVLGHEQLRDLWSDPVLKYSNVLDGLFHRGVVVCEADADSLFFSAALDHWLAQRNLPAGEVLFTFSGGKAGLYKVAAALRAVRVPVMLLADVDIINDAGVLQRSMVSLGADPTRLLELQRLVNTDVTNSAPNPRKEYVEDQIRDILGNCPAGEPLPAQALTAIRKVLRSTSPWSPIKDAGLRALRGDVFSRAQELLEVARAAGLEILETGELEAFEPGIAAHGPEWVAAALEAGVHQRDEAQSVAERISTWFGLA